ncbi:MAG TPA: PKD domain-containing protein [Thermoanaerobaculia bacterium]|jgi:hypothetical protein
MSYKAARLVPLALAVAGLIAIACDEGTPVSPVGSILRISAQPTRIGASGASTVTVQALRGNGNPVNEGTEIRLATSIGTIDEVVHTDRDGVAKATLRGDGRVGTATISAYSGAVEPVTTEVGIGSLAASVRLQVTPSSVPEGGGILALLALVRDDQGQPLPEASVNFASDAGTLASGGSFLLSDANGEARDTLTLTAEQLLVVGSDSFEVSAEVGGVGGVVADTFAVAIQRPPTASFTFSRVDNTVAFTDTSTGGPTSWFWDFGDGNTSSQQNPVNTYSVGGTSYIVTLTVQNAVGSDTANATVAIP